MYLLIHANLETSGDKGISTVVKMRINGEYIGCLHRYALDSALAELKQWIIEITDGGHTKCI